MVVIRKLILGLLKVFLLVTALLALVAVAAWFYPEKFLCVDSGPVSADVLVVLAAACMNGPCARRNCSSNTPPHASSSPARAMT